jgi:hypothetical protein
MPDTLSPAVMLEHVRLMLIQDVEPDAIVAFIDGKPDHDITDPAETLSDLADWPCQKYNPPHDCSPIHATPPLPCGPCTARAFLAVRELNDA